MALNFGDIIKDFLEYVNNKGISIYNEFSLQFELGIYLREKKELKTFNVEFERNVSYFGLKTHTVKHEIDIVVYNDEYRYAIELKYPKNGKYPEEMYSFIEDIVFMEQLKKNNFTKTYVLTIIDDPLFYKGRKVNEGIYAYFRGYTHADINGRIYKPTGSDKNIKYFDVSGSYKIEWLKWKNEYKYYFIEIK